MKIIAASDIAEMIFDNTTIIPSGFGCCGHSDPFIEALRKSFEQTGQPHFLNLLLALGTGDKTGKGLDRLSKKGMIKQKIGGFRPKF